MPTDNERRPANHWHLRRANWLSTLTAAQAAVVRRASRQREYAPRESIFHPTRDPHCVYLLEEGLVRIFRLSSGGDEFTVGYVRPGEIFGEVSVITKGARASFAQATKRTRVLEIPKDAFLKAMRSSRPLYEITKRMGARLIRCQSRAEDLVFCDARTRLGRLLLRLVDELGRRTEHGLAVGLRLTGQDIATLVGASRQTVSLILREMIRTGVIVRRNGELVVGNRRALEEIAKLATA